MNYSYLADGTKTSSLKASGEGLVYCRWMTPDPLNEKYYGLSPYNYCGGDPVNAVDLDGEKWQNPQEALKLIKEVKRRIRELNIAEADLQKNSSSYADLKEQE